MTHERIQINRGTQRLASFTAEQTARFFAGGELGRPQFADPAVQAAQDRQREALRAALTAYVNILGSSLHHDSEATERRLRELSRAAFADDPKAKQLLLAMLNELTRQALA